MTDDQRPSDPSKTLTERLDVSFALQAAELGVWEIDPTTHQVLWDNRCQALVGLDKQGILTFEQATQYIHPDDLTRVVTAIQWAMTPQSGGRFDETYRTVGADEGRLRWVRFWGQAQFTSAGELARFSGIAQEVTQQILDKQQLIDQQAQLRSVIQQTSAPTLVLRGDDYRIDQINQPMLAFMGRGEEVIGQPFLTIMPELADQFAWQQVQRVYKEGIDFDQSEVLVPHVRNGLLQNIYYNVSYRPLREGGKIAGMIQVAIDVTDRVIARQQTEESQRQILALFEQSPVGIAIISEDNLTFRMANPFYGYLVGRTPQDIVGKSLLEALPELKGQGFDDLLREVIATGTPFIAKEVKVEVVRHGRLESIWVDLTYQPRREADNRISGILVVAIDVTQQVISRQQIEESESKLRAILETAPAGIGVFVGRDLVIENPNQTFIDIVGKGSAIAGLPLRAAMPELISEGQPFLQILDDVFTTGEPFISPGSLVKIVQNGVMTHKYYNISYSPVRNATGEVYAILDIAIDVTEQIQAQQALKESQDRLQSVIDLADLGSYTIDLVTNRMIKSPLVAQWYGLPETTDVSTSLNAVDEQDRERVSQVLANALEPGSDGFFEVEYTIHHAQTANQRILRTNGQVHWNDNGQPTRINGSVMDITNQRALQLTLEQQVQQRTEELAITNEELTATNEELAANNEEYATLNEELEEANFLLNRSNDNLQQFAYVASHDLQEPLRKVQQFGDLLKTRYAQAGSEELVYLERMQSAAARMSVLIKDLLNYSRINTQRDTSAPIALNTVVDDVLTDLELLRAETQARIDVDALPVVEGDAGQMGQLFQNLLSNALKFRRPQVTPYIQIKSDQVPADQLPPWLKPSRAAHSYYQIEVIDNGIGFDEKYLDRIFQVFQRLHGKSEYVGTGIGLAICEKVVTNHGGAITARSQPGQGATFSIYLPV